MRLIKCLVMAFTTYSRIPMPQVAWDEENRKYALCFFPLIGAVIGGIELFWFYICGLLGMEPLLRAAIGTLIPILITGGIHVDGFMDTSDALAAWQGKERRLEILKDSHVGAFAVIRYGEYLLLTAALYAQMRGQDVYFLATGYIASRAMSAIAAATLKGARENGMLTGFTRESGKPAIVLAGGVYLIVCAVIWLILRPVQAAITLCACTLSFVLYRRMAYKSFGGVTGDLAGWFLCVTELLISASIVVGGFIK